MRTKTFSHARQMKSKRRAFRTWKSGKSWLFASSTLVFVVGAMSVSAHPAQADLTEVSVTDTANPILSSAAISQVPDEAANGDQISSLTSSFAVSDSTISTISTINNFADSVNSVISATYNSGVSGTAFENAQNTVLVSQAATSSSGSSVSQLSISLAGSNRLPRASLAVTIAANSTADAVSSGLSLVAQGALLAARQGLSSASQAVNQAEDLITQPASSNAAATDSKATVLNHEFNDEPKLEAAYDLNSAATAAVFLPTTLSQAADLTLASFSSSLNSELFKFAVEAGEMNSVLPSSLAEATANPSSENSSLALGSYISTTIGSSEAASPVAAYLPQARPESSGIIQSHSQAMEDHYAFSFMDSEVATSNGSIASIPIPGADLSNTVFPKTGDEANLLPFAGAAMLAGAATLKLLHRRKSRDI